MVALTMWDWVLIGAGGLLVLMAVLVLLIRQMLKAREPMELTPAELAIDLARLDATGPRGLPTQLEFYGVPVRLVVLVLAPKGHSMQSPNDEQLQVLIDRIAPGMRDVLRDHRPRIERWPNQLSIEGFTHAFFHNVALPGEEGPGTPWCGITGHFSAGMGSLLVGMACLADEPNQLGPVALEHDGQWKNVLKVVKSDRSREGR